MQPATNLYTWSEHMLPNLGNPRWVAENAERLQSLIPEQWTDLQKTNPLDIGYGLRLVGVDFRTEAELTLAIAYLQQVGIIRMRQFAGGKAQLRRGQLIVTVQQGGAK